MKLSFVKRFTHEVTSVSATINTTHTHTHTHTLSSDEFLTNVQQECETNKAVPEQSDHLSSLHTDKQLLRKCGTR